MQSITSVPPMNVGRVVQDFIDDGAVKVLVEAAADGTYTVSATWA